MKKKYLLILFLISMSTLMASCRPVKEHPNVDVPNYDMSKLTLEVPEDFSFTITFNTHGISSYNSKTGKLVKSNIESNVKDYTTYVKMSENELKIVYHCLFKDILLTDYPFDYDPYYDPNSEVQTFCSPSKTITISATRFGETKFVNCNNICGGPLSECYGEKGKAFMTSMNNIISLITSFPEWDELPDFTIFFL